MSDLREFYLGIIDAANPSVLQYLEEGTYERRRIPANQQTIRSWHTMNSVGHALHDTTQSRWEAGEIKAHLPYWSVTLAASGPMMCNDESVGMTSKYNQRVTAPYMQDGETHWLATSNIVMISKDRNWCLTVSGSIYGLDPEGEREEWQLCESVRMEKIVPISIEALHYLEPPKPKLQYGLAVGEDGVAGIAVREA